MIIHHEGHGSTLLTIDYEHEGFVGAGLKPALPNFPNPSSPEPGLSDVEGCLRGEWIWIILTSQPALDGLT
jgi:hypothetical protein